MQWLRIRSIRRHSRCYRSRNESSRLRQQSRRRIEKCDITVRNVTASMYPTVNYRKIAGFLTALLL
jgi:hypothetical protein